MATDPQRVRVGQMDVADLVPDEVYVTLGRMALRRLDAELAGECPDREAVLARRQAVVAVLQAFGAAAD